MQWDPILLEEMEGSVCLRLTPQPQYFKYFQYFNQAKAIAYQTLAFIGFYRNTLQTERSNNTFVKQE